MTNNNGDAPAAEATMPICPPWCVSCRDISSDLPGSRIHHGATSAPIPALIDITDDKHVRVRTVFCDVYPPLRQPPPVCEDTARIALCVSDHEVIALLPSDARQLAAEILQRADEIERSPSTRPPSA